MNKNFSVNLLSKLITSSTFLLLFFIFFLVIFRLHVSFINVQVVLFAALIDVLIVSIALGCFIFLSKISIINLFNAFEKIMIILVFILFGYIFSFSFPALIDRSLSFYILEKLEEAPLGIKYDRFDDLFIRDFSRKYHMIDVRLTEQLNSGTIYIKDNCVLLTEKGKNIADFSKFFRKYLLPKSHRYLFNGKYENVEGVNNDMLINKYGCLVK
jgi:hypothetical protein